MFCFAPIALRRYVADLLLASVGHEVEQGHVLVAAGLGVRDAGETVELEAEGVAALAPVHVVAEGEDDLQHLAKALAALHLLAGLQHGLDHRVGLRISGTTKFCNNSLQRRQMCEK